MNAEIQGILHKIDRVSESDALPVIAKLKHALKNARVMTAQKLEILDGLGRLYYRIHDFKNSEKYLEQGETLANKVGDRRKQVLMRLSTCNLLRRQGKYLEAIEKNKENLRLIESIEDTIIRCRLRTTVLYGTANNLHTIGMYNEALEYGQEALKESQNLPPNAVQRHQPPTVLGLIFWALENADQAEYYFKEAIRLSRELNCPYDLADNLDNLGSIMCELRHDNESALEYSKQSLEITRELKDSTGLVYGLTNLCSTCIQLKKYQEAKKYVDEAISVAAETGSVVCIALAKKMYGYFLVETGHINEGIIELKESLAKNTLAFKDRIFTIQTLAQTLERSGKLSDAITYIREERDLRIAEEEKKKSAIEEYRSYQLKKEHKQEMKRQKQDLEIKEQHLANSAIHLATQTEILGNFRNEMRAIVREINEPIAALKKIKEKLKELPCESVDWVKFEKEFIAVHPEFRAKLIEKYPDLTKQEIKMCQLARLGLKTYEMSRLLCLSERTIDGHRNSLRKKLGFKPNENLKDFLQNIKPTSVETMD